MANYLVKWETDLDKQRSGWPLQAGNVREPSGALRPAVHGPNGQTQTGGAGADLALASHTCTDGAAWLHALCFIACWEEEPP